MYRGFVFSLIICTLSFFSAHAAPIPDEVMKPYKAFTEAYQNKDYKTAVKHAKKAWTAAEKKIGDGETTGDLAFVYGKLALQLGDASSAVKPLIRSADLAELSKNSGALIRLEREVELATAMLANNQKTKAWKRIDKARAFASANDLDESVFSAELRVHQARISALNANRIAKYSEDKIIGTRIFKEDKVGRTQSQSASYASDAIAIFEKTPKQARWDYLATAYKLIGFSYERDKDWLDATLAYQKVMEIQESHLKREERASITTIGRWTNTRMHLLADMEKEKAYEKGLCKCWPYNGSDSDVIHIASPVKRIPPKMPSRATTSGFSFMRFDLDDGGKPINVKIIHSWPEKMYDKSSIAAIKSWRYTPRIPEETDAQRKNLRTDIRYILTDYYGGDPI